MDSIVQLWNSVREHHPRRLKWGSIALFVLQLISVLLYNQRWIVGSRYYSSEFSISSQGHSNISTTCFHTLKEQNLWNRIERNDDWYWAMRCEGNRDGTGYVAPVSKLPTFKIPGLKDVLGYVEHPTLLPDSDFPGIDAFGFFADRFGNWSIPELPELPSVNMSNMTSRLRSKMPEWKLPSMNTVLLTLNYLLTEIILHILGAPSTLWNALSAIFLPHTAASVALQVLQWLIRLGLIYLLLSSLEYGTEVYDDLIDLPIMPQLAYRLLIILATIIAFLPLGSITVAIVFSALKTLDSWQTTINELERDLEWTRRGNGLTFILRMIFIGQVVFVLQWKLKIFSFLGKVLWNLITLPILACYLVFVFGFGGILGFTLMGLIGSPLVVLATCLLGIGGVTTTAYLAGVHMSFVSVTIWFLVRFWGLFFLWALCVAIWAAFTFYGLMHQSDIQAHVPPERESGAMNITLQWFDDNVRDQLHVKDIETLNATRLDILQTLTLYGVINAPSTAQLNFVLGWKFLVEKLIKRVWGIFQAVNSLRYIPAETYKRFFRRVRDRAMLPLFKIWTLVKAVFKSPQRYPTGGWYDVNNRLQDPTESRVYIRFLRRVRDLAMLPLLQIWKLVKAIYNAFNRWRWIGIPIATLIVLFVLNAIYYFVYLHYCNIHWWSQIARIKQDPTYKITTCRWVSWPVHNFLVKGFIELCISIWE